MTLSILKNENHSKVYCRIQKNKNLQNTLDFKF
jgi:hypothetical protein